MKDTKNKEIFYKVIQKAVKNGWTQGKVFLELIEDTKHTYALTPMLRNLCFHHEFAKAFFGEKDMWKETKCTCGGVDFHLAGYDVHYKDCTRLKAKRGYLFHLKELAITPDNKKLNYLEKFL